MFCFRQSCQSHKVTVTQSDRSHKIIICTCYNENIVALPSHGLQQGLLFLLSLTPDINQTFSSTPLGITAYLIYLCKPQRWLRCENTSRLAVCGSDTSKRGTSRVTDLNPFSSSFLITRQQEVVFTIFIWIELLLLNTVSHKLAGSVQYTVISCFGILNRIIDLLY